MTNSERTAHSSPIFKKFKLLNIFDINKLQTTSFVQKTITESPNFPFRNFQHYFYDRTEIHTHDTRYRHQLTIKRFRTENGRKSIAIKGAILYNKLDEDTKKAKHIKHFERMLKNNLISKYT